MQFWINYLVNNNPSPDITNRIISIFMNCYLEILSSNLVQLARIPSIHKDINFINYLTTKFDSQILSASGFRVSVPSNVEKKTN